MTKSGQTANGIAHFAPMMELKAPQWNMRNPFNDLIGIALKEREMELKEKEMELKEKEMELKEKGLGLDEQKFAYGAANDEANRQNNIELQKIKNQNELDKVIQEYSLKNNYANRLEAKENLEDARIEEVRRFISQIHDDIIRSGQNTPRVEVAKNLEDYLRNHSGFKNKHIDEAMGLENFAGNYKATQSGNGKYNIGNRNTDFR
ncbi:hypothetical protein V2I21_05400 [Campylobacter sp. CLAX-22107-21]|uniref:hypothetical protein n=1 Tax=Campylobacter devanensis TaxID=3161138 RepID=UPI002EC2B6FA|nr:hypothetical protein [Campylobacter sp. CLAX-22107-21]